MRGELDRELTQRRVEIERIERRIEKKEENIDDKAQKVEQREQAVRKSESRLQSQQDSWENEKVRKDKEVEEHRQSVLNDLEDQRQQQMQEIEQSRQFYHNELERVAGLTATEARDQLIADIEAEARHMAQRHVHEIEREARDEADKRARKILATTIQRIASDYVSESTVSVVPLPNDDMKGRIIGREGRNIRALETATGVDLIVDDTPRRSPSAGSIPFAARLRAAPCRNCCRMAASTRHASRKWLPKPKWNSMRSCGKKASAWHTMPMCPASIRIW